MSFSVFFFVFFFCGVTKSWLIDQAVLRHHNGSISTTATLEATLEAANAVVREAAVTEAVTEAVAILTEAVRITSKRPLFSLKSLLVLLMVLHRTTLITRMTLVMGMLGCC